MIASILSKVLNKKRNSTVGLSTKPSDISDDTYRKWIYDKIESGAKYHT